MKRRARFRSFLNVSVRTARRDTQRLTTNRRAQWCMCVCVHERERARARVSNTVNVYVCVCVCDRTSQEDAVLPDVVGANTRT